MKPLLSLLLMSVVLLMGSCHKWGDEDPLPDSMKCEITGQLRIRDLDVPACFDPVLRPTIILHEQRWTNSGDLLTPSYPYRVPISKYVVDENGKYKFDVHLKKEFAYYLDVVDHDTSLYLNMETPYVPYVSKQQVHYYLVARSWAIPRFVNSEKQPGDVFHYIFGIGGNWVPPLSGNVDTIMPWCYKTWGGKKVGNHEHYIFAKLTRHGIERDTKIYYFVPPGDTSVITIAY